MIPEDPTDEDVKLLLDALATSILLRRLLERGTLSELILYAVLSK